MTFPVKGPDGVLFKSYYDSLRLENMGNLALGGKYMYAAWIKIIPNPFNNNCYYRSIMRSARYTYSGDLFFDLSI